MPLMSTWPPIAPHVAATLDEWDRWYCGVPTVETARTRKPSGGLLGMARHVVWGPAPESTQPGKLHLPVAQDIASASAAMLFGESVGIEWPDAAVGDRFTEIRRVTALDSLLGEAAELAAALGGVWLRVSWDTAVAKAPLLDLLGPDQVRPAYHRGQLRSAVAWQTLATDQGRIWRHLETHTAGVIEHSLYLGTSSSLGDRVSLKSLEATAELPEVIRTGLDTPALLYVPNIRPVPQWRTDPEASWLGRADIGAGGTTSLLAAIDDIWSSWVREFRLGKARLMVSSTLLAQNAIAPGSGATFDLDQELHEVVRFSQGEDARIDDLISAQQFNLRVTEHSQTLNALLEAATRSAGYSPSTFGYGATAAATATEIASRDRRTAQAMERKTRTWGRALEDLLMLMNGVDHTIFGGPLATSRPAIAFADTTSTSAMEQAAVISTLRTAQAMSIETAIRTAQPDLDEAGVRAEYARITGDNPDPLGFSDVRINPTRSDAQGSPGDPAADGSVGDTSPQSP